MDTAANFLARMIEPLVASHGYTLVDVNFGTVFRRRTLTVYIDKTDGVPVAACQMLAGEIGRLLDERDAVSGSYVLEVSSPGAERPLKTDKDFQYFQGRYALLRTKERIPEVGRDEVYGYLRGLTGDHVLLELEDGRSLSIPKESIQKARLAIKV